MSISTNSSSWKPKCPPAKGPSITRKSAVVLYFLSHILSIMDVAFKLETIGAILLTLPFTNSGKLIGKPAPLIITSAFASTAAFTYSAYCFVATMILTPTIPPFAISFARCRCFLIARRFASIGFLLNSSSSYPI